MKNIYTIFSDIEKEYLLYEALNKYTEQDIKDAYKIAQDWTACFIKYAAHMGVELNKENA